MRQRRMAIGRIGAALAVIILLTVATAGYIFLVPHSAGKTTVSVPSTSASSSSTESSASTASSTTTELSTSTASATSTASTFSAVTSTSNGPMPNASSIEIANVTVSKLHVFPAPLEIATDPVAGTIYLGAYSSNNLTVVNATTYAVIGRISLLGLPGNGISVDSRNDWVYVPISVCTNETVSMSNCPGGSRVRQIAVIDGKNYSVIGEIHMALSLLTFDSSSGVMFASQTGTSFLLGTNPQSGAIVANVTIGDIYSIAVNQLTNMVYAESCTSGSASCDGEVKGVNASSGEVRFSVPMTYDRVANLIVDSTNDMVYALGDSPAVELLAIDGASGAMRYLSILAGCNIYSGTTLSLVFNPALKQVYVISNAWLIAVYAETGQLAYVLGIPGAWSAGVSADGLYIYLAMAPASLANVDAGYLLVIPVVAANETYVTNFAQEGCHAGTF